MSDDRDERRARRERRNRGEDEGTSTTPTQSTDVVSKLATMGDDEFGSSGNKFVWVADDTPIESPSNVGFIQGEIKKQSGDTFEIALVSGSMVNVKKSAFVAMNNPKDDGIEDMARLPILNDASLLHNLKWRYAKDDIYTYSGLFLIAINPYKPLPIYEKEFVSKHQGRKREDVPPHVFTFADYAYRSMLLNRKNQSMLVTGESGAGKTENTKKIIQYLTSIASSTKGGDLEQRLLKTNPLLEAFGNAKTTKNDNSSRFGKFIEINFNSSGYIIGTNIVNYLLETTRTISQLSEERNYHIFYQMLADPATKEKFRLTSPGDYEILKNGCFRVDGVDDKKELADTIECMKTIGLNENEIDFVFSTVAGCLHLGNVTFSPNEKDLAQLDDSAHPDALKNACHYFKCKASELQKALIKPKLTVGREVIETHETPERANFNKNSLLKSIYNRLFNWIVTRVNESLATKETVRSWIGVLDIAGFEIFQVNSFEQLCINFTNEKLQQFFNNHMFVKEQEEYAREKVEWEQQNFGLDLQPTIDLIEKSGGILNTLEDQNAQKQTNSSKLRDLYIKNCAKRYPDSFRVDNLDAPNIFNLLHYAGKVPYNTDNWLLKNVDPMNDDCATALYASKNKYMQYLFRDSENIETKKRNAAFATVSKEYRTQLQALMTKLESTEPHFIRCIIPNRIKKPGILDAQLILHQMKCNGVREGLRIARKGYPGRVEFPYFIQRYGLLCGDSELSAAGGNKDKCNAIIKKAKLVHKEEYFVGLTKVFLKTGIETKLERLRDVYVDRIIITVQAASKGFLARQNYKRLLEQVEAIKIIQNNWRAYQQLKNWVWWDLFSASRPQVEFWKQEQERLKQEKEIEDLRKQIEAEKAAKQQIEDEKRALQAEIMKLNAEIDSKSQKLGELRNEEDNIKDKHRDFESTIDQYKREKALALAAKDKLQKLLRQKEDLVRQREKDSDALSTQIKEGGNALTMLQNQIRDQTSQKLKLEAQSKRLGEELTDTKNKLSESQSKSSDLEREKNGLDDKIREVNYRVDVIEQEKVNLEKKRGDLEKDVRELEKKLKKAKQDILNFTQSNGQKDSLLSTLQTELQDSKKKLDELGRQKKQLENLNSELNGNLLDLDKKKTDVERLLRDARDDAQDVKNKMDKLSSDIAKLEETSKIEGSELSDLRARLAKLTESKGQLEKQKTDLEKELADIKFALADAKDKGQREVDALNKKALDIERELMDQINQVNTTKSALDKKIKDQEKAKKDLKKEFDRVQGERDNLEMLYKKLEQTLSSEQGDLQGEKKKLAELEIARKDLTSRLNELEIKLKEDQENNQKLDNKRRELQNLADEYKDKIDQLEKERDDLAQERNENAKTLTQLTLDLGEMNSQLNILSGKADSQDLELTTLKGRLDDATSYLNKLKDEGKISEQKLIDLNSQLENERNEKTSLLKKLSKLEEEISKLKKKIDEETEVGKKESAARNLLEVELREKRTQVDSEIFQRGELEKKVKAAEAKLAELEKSRTDIVDQLTKLKNEEAGLLSNVQSLQEEVDDLEHKMIDVEGGDKDLKEKFNDIDKKRQEIVSQRQKLAGEQQRLKNEIDIQKELNNQNEKKQDTNLEQMKRKMELSDAEFEQKVKALSNDREELKKELKSLGKREVQTEGKVPKEQLIKLTQDFQSEVDKLRKEIEEERKQKLASENTKRNLEAQLVTFKDQMEQEERQKKKVILQKKNLAGDIEELKEMADEVEDLNADLERLKLENETVQTELKNEIQRERNSRQAAEYSLIKVERESAETKKALEDLKRQDDEILRKLRVDYEAQLQELDDGLEREKKSKKTVGKVSTKAEREIRDLERRLFATEREKQIAQEREAGFNKDVVKLREEILDESKKVAQAEAQNKILSRDVDTMKQKLRDLEEETAKVRSEALREKQRPKAQPKKKRVVDSDEDSE